MTKISLIGTYRVTVTDDELQFMAKCLHGVENARDELSRTALIEIEVRDADSDFEIGEIDLPWDQVPYDEIYFALNGIDVIARGSDKPVVADFRACFYLHDFDAGDTIESPYGDLKTGEIVDLPERLARECVYQHP
jgi:hypothetical protein